MQQIPPNVGEVLTRWGRGLKTQGSDDSTEYCLGPDSNEWAAFRYLQDTRAVESFAKYLLPFVQNTLGSEFTIHTTRLVGGASFRIVFANETHKLIFFNRIDVAGLQINAHAILSTRQGISIQ